MRDGRPTGLPKGPFSQQYIDLRATINNIEHTSDLIFGELTEKQIKRLDKAIILMKVGAKLMKKAIKEPKKTNVVPIRATNT